MGVYGNIHGAFNGLGKPSIKLEFEDNEALLDFQRRMQEPDGGNDDPDGGNFTPSTYTQEQLDDAVKNHTVTGWGIFPEIPDGWQLVKTSAAPKGFNVITKGEPSFEMTTEGWKFKHSLDAALIEKKKGLKVVKDDEEPVDGVKQNKEAFLKEIYSYTEKLTPKEFSYSLLEKELGKDKDGVYTIVTPVFPVYFRRERLFERNQHILNHIGKNFNVIKRTLKDPYIIFESVDKNNIPCIDFVKCFKVKGKKILVIFSAIDPKTFNVSTIFEPDDPDEYVWEKYIKGRERRLYTRNASVSECYTSKIDGLGDTSFTFKAVNFCLPCIITENGAKSCVSEEKSLGAAGDLYLVRDMRTRSRKEPGELAANKNLKFEKQKNDTIKNFNKELYAAPTLANGNKEINGKTYYPVKFGYKYGKNDRYISEVYLFIPKIYNASENKMRGSWRSFDVVIDADKLYNIERNPYSGGFQAYEDEATLRKNTNDALRQAFADVQRNVDYQKEQIEKEKNSPWKSAGMIAKREKYLKEAYKELKYFIMFYANFGKYSAWIMSDNNGGDYPAKMAEDIPEGYIDRSIFAANLAAPGDLGKTANNTLYNNNDILDCRGLAPTYRILPNYDAFFAPAQNVNTFAGVGLTDTKKLIADICKAHYKDCAKIAAHLKADTKLQSVFNLWHWMRHNIRYEYDREGREEVRTPLRTYADRRRGVDCDCLSVFAWCVLKCMGYDPAFELVCFKGKKQPSHILVNLDGIRCDRVWFVFNSLPPGVTNSEIYRITDRATAAQLAGLFN